MNKNDCQQVIDSLSNLDQEEVRHRCCRLNDRERVVLSHIYKAKDKNVPELAKMLDISMERVLQIRDKGIRKLSMPYISKKTLEAIRESADMSKDYKAVLETVTLEYLNLSVRAYNGLCRSGIHTVNEVLEAFSTGKIFMLRNIGDITIEEIRNKTKIICKKVLPSELYKSFEEGEDFMITKQIEIKEFEVGDLIDLTNITSEVQRGLVFRVSKLKSGRLSYRVITNDGSTITLSTSEADFADYIGKIDLSPLFKEVAT